MPQYKLFSRNEVLCAVWYMTVTLCTDLLEKIFHSCVFLTVSDVQIKTAITRNHSLRRNVPIEYACV
jgi:hypothetical protein